MKIKRGKNLCGISNIFSYPIVKAAPTIQIPTTIAPNYGKCGVTNYGKNLSAHSKIVTCQNTASIQLMHVLEIKTVRFVAEIHGKRFCDGKFAHAVVSTAMNVALIFAQLIILHVINLCLSTLVV